MPMLDKSTADAILHCVDLLLQISIPDVDSKTEGDESKAVPCATGSCLMEDPTGDLQKQ